MGRDATWGCPWWENKNKVHGTEYLGPQFSRKLTLDNSFDIKWSWIVIRWYWQNPQSLSCQPNIRRSCMYVDWIAATEQARVNDQKKVVIRARISEKRGIWFFRSTLGFQDNTSTLNFQIRFFSETGCLRDKFYFPRVEQYTSNVPLTYFRPFSRKLAACEYFFSRKYASDEKNFTLTRFLLLSSQRIRP